MRAIFNFCDTEGDAAQRLGIVAVQLDNIHPGPLTVGENELCVFIRIQLNDALCCIDHITCTTLFGDHIGTGRQLAQVNLAAFISGKLFGSIVSGNCLDLKDSVGDDLGGIKTVYFHKT